MKFGNYMFENFKEFQQVKNLAIVNGVGTGENFFKFFHPIAITEFIKL